MKKIVISGFVAAFLMLVIGMALNFVLGIIFPSLPKEYQSIGLFRPWSDPIDNLFCYEN